MPLLPDSGDPGDMHEQLGIGKTKPELLTEATWQHISQTYQLRGDLGQGGQAVVLFVKEKAEPHRKQALKVYHENTDSARRLFEQECRVLASAYLPADLVVGYFHCVAEPGLQPYLVLEHIDGKPIHEYVSSARKMSLSEKLDLFETLCRSVQRLHDCNLVFGDLSANNVLVEPGDRIRFIDLAGSKLLAKGYSLSQSSINIGTPGMLPDSVLTGEARTARWTDIYATAAIGFLILTGKSHRECGPMFNPNANGVGGPAGTASNTKTAHADGVEVKQWDAELTAHHIPRAIRKLILKGLREPAPNKLVDPDLYPTAKQLADDLANWKRQGERRRQGLLIAAMMLLVALPGALGWFKWNEARQASNLVASQRMIDDLRQQFDQLPARVRESVKSLREEATNAERQLNESPAHGATLSERLELANAARSEWRRVLQVSREIERGTDLREAIGLWLEKRDGEAEYWATDAPPISQRLTALRTRFRDLERQLASADVGETDGESGLVKRLSNLLAELKQFMVVNETARGALQAKLGYEREKRSVSERIQKLGEFLQIDKTAQRGEQGFAAGEFNEAKTNYGSATQSLTEFLQQPNIETVEEKQKRHQVTIGLVNKLEEEKSRLVSRVAQLTEEVSGSEKLIAQQLAKSEKAEEARAAAVHELKDAKPKLVEYDKTKAALTKAMTELAATQKSLTEQQAKLRGIEPQLAEAIAEKTKAEKRTNEDAEQIRQLEVALQKYGADAVKRAKEIAELNTKIAEVDPKQLKQAEDAFAAARDNYGKVLGLRDDFVATQKPKSTNEELGKRNEALAVAEEQLVAAHTKLEDAHLVVYNAKQPPVTAAEKALEKARAGYEDDSPEVKKAQQTLANAKSEQQPFAAAALRASGSGKKLTIAEIVTLAGAGGFASDGFGNRKAGTEMQLTIDGVVLDFVWIPAGKFKMGTPPGETGHQDDEAQKEVTLTRGFWMLKTEITQAMYTLFAKEQPWKGQAYAKEGPRYPASYVSWNAANAWCEKATTEARRKGLLTAKQKIALPMEAQWEYAARAATTTAYFFGNDAAKLGDYAWYDKNAWDIGEQYAHEVGKKKPNPWGLLDITGNVFEWCADSYSATLPGGTDPFVGPLAGSSRVCRGASFYGSTINCRVGFRHYADPAYSYDYIGFRVVLSVE
ncbi:MAG: SUMF1/EgtB/PvdO family nonheme iron enzyme [Planctomycetaceae bacterium]